MQLWVNGDDAQNVIAISKALEQAVKEKSNQELKAFVIYLTSSDTKAPSMLEKWGNEIGNNIALTWLAKTDSAIQNYKFNTALEVKNTIFIYKKKKVLAKFINFVADEKGLKELKTAIDKVTE